MIEWYEAPIMRTETNKWTNEQLTQQIVITYTNKNKTVYNALWHWSSIINLRVNILFISKVKEEL